jgi:hypothetical protein
MKLKFDKRMRKLKQESPSGDLVLAKWQPTSGAAQKISVKFLDGSVHVIVTNSVK